MLKVLPFPRAVAQSIFPPCSLMTCWAYARPRPVPSLFVVKNGTKRFRASSSVMPTRLSLTIKAKRRWTEVWGCGRNNGRGMTEEEARNLFVPFFTTKSDGTGLGLAYAQQVINEHGGKIDCATVRGKGSTFSIQLPLAVGA